jgi:hypothetical protein
LDGNTETVDKGRTYWIGTPKLCTRDEHIGMEHNLRIYWTEILELKGNEILDWNIESEDRERKFWI